MKAQEFALAKVLKFEPENGRLLIGEDRMLMFRQEAFGTLRKLLYEQLGEQLGRALLSQFGFRCGNEDYEALSRMFAWDAELDKLAAGPTMHTWEGIVKATATLVDFDRKKKQFHMAGTWENSYEADVHLTEFGSSTEPVCHTLTGYASGWCSSFFGAPCVAVETKCRGRGDEICEFEVRHVEGWGQEAEPWKQALSATNYSLTSDLEAKLNMIEAQRRAIAQLSTPIIQVWDEILCLPVIGVVDTSRSAEMTDRLLDTVVSQRARAVIIDITGIEVMDTKTADHFIKMAKAVKLLGAEPVITGTSPSIAQTLTHIGVDLGDIRTLRSLRDALRVLTEELGCTIAASA